MQGQNPKTGIDGGELVGEGLNLPAPGGRQVTQKAKTGHRRGM
jgi:hypothetical protein